MYSVSKRWSLDAAPESKLVLSKEPGRQQVQLPKVSAEEMSALKQALPRYTQEGGVLVPLVRRDSQTHGHSCLFQPSSIAHILFVCVCM